jgi:hypothetical protein
MVQALTDREWAAVSALQQKVPPTEKDHIHFVFYKNADILGYAHLQLLPKHQALLHVIVMDDQNWKARFLKLCERWLLHQGFKMLWVQSTPETYPFFCNQGYRKMPDPSGSFADMGKVLNGNR